MERKNKREKKKMRRKEEREKKEDKEREEREKKKPSQAMSVSSGSINSQKANPFDKAV